MWERVSDIVTPFTGRRITVEQHLVDNGDSRMTMDIASVQSAVAVLPVLKIDRETYFIFVKQHRYPVDQDGKVGPIIEACAGKIEDNQTPQDAAIAELKQETGYIAGRWDYLGEFYSSPGFTNEKIYAYAAYDLTPGKQELEISERGLEVVRVNSGDAMFMVQRNMIKDQKTSNLIMMQLCRNLKWGGPMHDAEEDKRTRL